MALIDYTYFQKRLLAIPNLTGANLEQLKDYIDIFEDRYFDIMLGVGLKNDFLSGLEEETIEEKWTNLKEGVEYEISGITYRWRGFTNDSLISPIANYIFCNLTADNQHLNTGIGEVRKKAENSVIITPQYRIGAAWNEMSTLNQQLWKYLVEYESTDYDNWEPDYKRAKSLLRYDYNIGL